MASSKTKNIEYSKKFRFKDNQLEYDFQIKKKRHWWWLLLLLLPLLLFIQYDRDIRVHTKLCDGTDIENATVNMSYTEYQLLKDGVLFYKSEHSYVGITDNNGLTTFINLPTGIFDWIFHHCKKVYVSAEKDGMTGSVEARFHRCCKKDIEILLGNSIVHIIDAETEDDVPNAHIRWRSTNDGSTLSDEHGMAQLDGVYCEEPLQFIEVKAKGYADTIIDGRALDDIMSSDTTYTIKLRPIDVGYTCDIVMCIDNTQSMSSVINTVKQNIINFQHDLTEYCARNGRKIKSSRVRVISFGDIIEAPIQVSPFYTLPSEKTSLSEWVSRIQSTDGEDGPEDALEAMALALRSEWNNEGTRRRQIIIIYTDVDAHPLGYRKHSSNYPANMPTDFNQLNEMWNALDKQTKRMVLFTQTATEPWERISSSWNCVTRKTASLGTIFAGSDYTDVLKTICESL